MKRRAPCSRNTFNSPCDGTCKNVGMPFFSNAKACSGRPPAINAKSGALRRTISNCSSRSASSTNPRTPTPQGLSPKVAFVSLTKSSASWPRIKASARNGNAPPSATELAKAARSLTRVIGPCTIGNSVPIICASFPPRSNAFCDFAFATCEAERSTKSFSAAPRPAYCLAIVAAKPAS